MPENPSLDPPRTSDPAATTDGPLAVADRTWGSAFPRGQRKEAVQFYADAAMKVLRDAVSKGY
jgi:hypothetical protein